MTFVAEKFKKICEVIYDRVAVADRARVFIFIGDFIQADKNIAIGEALAGLTRLQDQGAIHIDAIGQKANTPGGYDFNSLNISMLYRDPSYDERHPDRNKLSPDNLLTVSVGPGFLDVCSEQFGSPFPDAIVKKIIMEQQSLKDIDENLKKNPIKWNCPICRSSVGTLGKEGETVASQLEKFARGEYMKCKDRRHPNRFWIEDGKIRFGTVGISVSEIEKINPEKKSTDTVDATKQKDI
jgi:hypothetical protein